MKRRTFLKAAGGLAPVAGLAGCVTTSAVHSDVKARATVVDTEHHDDGAVTATIEVENQDAEGGTVGLHVHYFHGDYCDAANSYHSHMPTAYVGAGETVTVRDTYKHGDDVGCVSAHVHK